MLVPSHGVFAKGCFAAFTAWLLDLLGRLEDGLLLSSSRIDGVVGQFSTVVSELSRIIGRGIFIRVALSH